MRELLDIYRLRHAQKISGLRLLIYPLFGFAASGVFTAYQFERVGIAILDLATVFACLLVATVVNDFYDFRLRKEHNGIERFIDHPRTIIFAFGVPLIVAFVSLFILRLYPVTRTAYTFLWASFLLSFLYSLPLVRLKDRFVAGVIVPPIGIFFLFLQAFLLFGYPNQVGWVVAFFVFLFAWYLEFLHIIDDLHSGDGRKRMSIERGFFLLRAVAIIGGVAGLLFGVLVSPLFFISTVAWILRFVAIRNSTPADIARDRRSVLQPLWRLEEFAVYGAAGALCFASYFCV